MELLKLTEGIKEIFKIEEISELQDKLEVIMLGEYKAEIFNKYIELVEGDLETDYLQKVYQYHEADRDGKKQDFTPKCLGKLISKLTENNEEWVLDCCAGSGSLTIQKWNSNKNLKFICWELDKKVLMFLLFNLAIRNIEGYVINKDVITGEEFSIIKLVKGKKYSDVILADKYEQILTESAISNPPYNLKWDSSKYKFDKRFLQCLPPKSNANYVFLLSIMQQLTATGKMSMIMPNCILTSTDEAHVREYIINNNLVETVITLPDKMFESTSIPTCIISLNMNKKNNLVQMIDLRNTFKIEKREQRGQVGDKSKTSRIYVKEVKILTDEHIEDIVISIKERKNIPGYCACVDTEKVKSLEYNLQPSRYIEIAAEENESRTIDSIIDDINRVARDKNILKITMNETLARDTGFLDIKESLETSNKILESMNEMCGSYTEKSFLKLDYFATSKVKNEIKIENKDKEKLSEIIKLLLPMWKQHLMYLNTEENRYLVELRDTLLPKLMSGEIRVNTD